MGGDAEQGVAGGGVRGMIGGGELVGEGEFLNLFSEKKKAPLTVILTQGG